MLKQLKNDLIILDSWIERKKSGKETINEMPVSVTQIIIEEAIDNINIMEKVRDKLLNKYKDYISSEKESLISYQKELEESEKKLKKQ